MDTQAPPLRSVREQIVDQIRTEVLADGFDADQPLREVELAQRFGVSRGPIRDALLQLTHEGALVYHPNRGVRVGSPVSEEERGLLVVLRRNIERHALETVFDRLTEHDDERWLELLSQLERACAKRDMPAIVESDMAFHRSLIRRTGSRDLEAVWLPITVRMRLLYSRHDDLLEVHREHKGIVEAIVARDRETALERLTNHIF